MRARTRLDKPLTHNPVNTVYINNKFPILLESRPKSDLQCYKLLKYHITVLPNAI